MMVKAQVFISCGQLTPEEKAIGTAVVDYFKKRGFEPYFAEEVHSPSGLTQNVYANLKNSEYFVCINPKREQSDVDSSSQSLSKPHPKQDGLTTWAVTIDIQQKKA